MYTIQEIKVSYTSGNRDKVKITNSKDSYELFLSCWSQKTIELQEEFKVLLLNRNHQVLGIYPLSKGGVSGTIVDAKLVFSVALKCNASSIIIAHNHPSGNLKPSEADIRLTQKLKEAGSYLDVKVLDHIILSREGYYSFVDESQI
ncbi:JAB domain-containing protein [Mesoflavibacter sp. CH_XMU1422-2]|uniref:JAB domain-containing protein n=1 Tax=Mesoflavibacter sp. CH_XMU1422-2 TaxID=3107770 RepID=UPI00300A23DE